MSPKELTAFRIAPEIMDALRGVKDRDGIPLSVQVDRALRAWLDRKGASPKTPSPPASGRTARPTTRRRRA